jgi:hypothetical protein
MRTKQLVGITFLAVWTAATAISASDPTAVYARIDRVVLEPTADAPQRAQVWGVFAMAKPNDRNDYLPPARGDLSPCACRQPAGRPKGVGRPAIGRRHQPDRVVRQPL